VYVRRKVGRGHQSIAEGDDHVEFLRGDLKGAPETITLISEDDLTVRVWRILVDNDETRPLGVDTLRLDDLHGHADAIAKLMNLRIPERTAIRIDGVAATTGSTKTATVIALLNEGLAAWGELSRSKTPPSRPRRRRRGRAPRPRTGAAA
jgi:hypothetical protein